MLRFFGLGKEPNNTQKSAKLNPADYIVTQRPGVKIFTKVEDSKGTLKGKNVTVTSENTHPRTP